MTIALGRLFADAGGLGKVFAITMCLTRNMEEPGAPARGEEVGAGGVQERQACYAV